MQELPELKIICFACYRPEASEEQDLTENVGEILREVYSAVPNNWRTRN